MTEEEIFDEMAVRYITMELADIMPPAEGRKRALAHKEAKTQDWLHVHRDAIGMFSVLKDMGLLKSDQE